jgi:VIT1/CCC1 family predicted Fe2+/Mn2+ transporter
MMRFELGLERPPEGRATRSALTIAGSYCVGGLLPLAPYFLFDATRQALPVSSAVALIALFGFGALKGRLTGALWPVAGLQAAVIGALAALAAFLAARLLAPG